MVHSPIVSPSISPHFGAEFTPWQLPRKGREAPGLPKIHAGVGALISSGKRVEGGRRSCKFMAATARRTARVLQAELEIASMNEHCGSDQGRLRGVGNPFGVIDVPDAEDGAAAAFAAAVTLDGASEDANASAWAGAGDPYPNNGIEGLWSSRWNGGADPTIPGDAKDLWKHGKAELKTAGDRVYLLFDWASGGRWGLIHARREDDRLVGKYVNLTDRSIVRPWTGRILSDSRIDRRWPGGRLDFRRRDPANTGSPRS
jgi:hypothetical protein